jgi:hypothetical protein
VETNIEKQIYDLRLVLNKMVSKDINLTDESVVKVSVQLDNLLNIFNHERAGRVQRA